jgi:drug/metabolite transporter (DMT)-like permease
MIAGLANLSQPVRGVLAMLVSTLLLNVNDAVTKHLSTDYPVGQVVTLRQLVALLLILVYVAWRGNWVELSVRSWGGQIGRGLLFTLSTVLIVLAVSLLPLPVFTSLVFSSPIFIAALSVAFLGEAVSARRWLAIIGGFIGVLVIVRPGGADFSWMLLVPVVAAIASAMRDVATRWLARTETSLSILFWSNVVIVIAGLSSLQLGWNALTGTAAAWFVLLGFLNMSAHFLTIHSLRLADASLVGPYKYSGLIWAAIIAYVVWGDLPDRWTLAGAAIIAICGIYAIDSRSRR